MALIFMGAHGLWTILARDDADVWLQTLGPDDADKVGAVLDELSEKGPILGRPAVDRLKHAELHKLKELRPKSSNIRMVFAFDGDRQAVVLHGGDKTNQFEGWYRRAIKLAMREWRDHERGVGKVVVWRSGRTEPGRTSGGISR